jgi:hypothetical protein
VHEAAGSIRWAPRVPPALIRRLYEGDAAGLRDDDLLADVGFRLFERCRDILIASKAMAGAATCPRCDREVDHDGRTGTWLDCACGWRMRWSAYQRTFRDRWLRGGRATPYFVDFTAAWPAAQTVAEKMLAIDGVLHAMHVDSADARHGRHAVASVIEANEEEARGLLEELAGNAGNDARRAVHDRWRSVDGRTRRSGP